MLDLVRENQRKVGAKNIEFLKREIKKIRLPDNSVDVIISNWVIHLSSNKDRVLSEAYRVLRPGGRFAVSHIVTRGEIHDSPQRRIMDWLYGRCHGKTGVPHKSGFKIRKREWATS